LTAFGVSYLDERQLISCYLLVNMPFDLTVYLIPSDLHILFTYFRTPLYCSTRSMHIPSGQTGLLSSSSSSSTVLDPILVALQQQHQSYSTVVCRTRTAYNTYSTVVCRTRTANNTYSTVVCRTRNNNNEHAYAGRIE
jgi:hypothetical protein